MNSINARRFWLTWRSDIGAGIGLVVFMIAAFVVADVIGRIVVGACQ